MSFENTDGFTRGRIPETSGIVVAACGHAATVVRKDCAQQPVTVAGKFSQTAACGRVPDAGRLVGGCGQDLRTVGRKYRTADSVAMACERADQLPGTGVPQFGGPVIAGGEDRFSIG